MSNNKAAMSSHEFKATKIVKQENREVLEIEDTFTKPTNFWQKHKKPTVDYLHDSIFATNRQLEDQRWLIEYNRNPQAYKPTKVDKVRSQVIAAPAGHTRAVAMKANVLNKIVREASGIHNYTIVPPPRMASDKEHQEALDPETNPYVKPYAKEAKQKPVLVSYGHRPRSASRTFHPATMKIRLRRGEILPKNPEGKTTVGLPVAVLARVIHAPKIVNPLEAKLQAEEEALAAEREEQRDHLGHSLRTEQLDDLFFSKKQQDEMFSDVLKTNIHGKKMHKSRSEGGLQHGDDHESSTASWVSSKKPKKHKELEPLNKDPRPAWDEGFHNIAKKNSDLFKLKSSGFNSNKDVPLSELLRRFSKMTVAENQNHPFCTERQELDKKERSGVPTEVPKSVLVKGQPLYYDPWDAHVKMINDHHKQVEKEKAEKIAAHDYQMALHTIPKVDYYATSLLKQTRQGNFSAMTTLTENMSPSRDGISSREGRGKTKKNPTKGPQKPVKYSSKSRSRSRSRSRSHSRSRSGSRSPMVRAGSASGKNTATTFDLNATGNSKIDEIFPNWQSVEDEWNRSFKAAKRGDRRVLYDYTIGNHLRSEGDNNASALSWAGGDNTYTMDEQLVNAYADNFFGSEGYRPQPVQESNEEYYQLEENAMDAEISRADRFMMMAHSDENEEDEDYPPNY